MATDVGHICVPHLQYVSNICHHGTNCRGQGLINVISSYLHSMFVCICINILSTAILIFCIGPLNVLCQNCSDLNLKNILHFLGHSPSEMQGYTCGESVTFSDRVNANGLTGILAQLEWQCSFQLHIKFKARFWSAEGLYSICIKGISSHSNVTFRVCVSVCVCVCLYLPVCAPKLLICTLEGSRFSYI